jgi:hypothetical protein
MFTSYSIRVEAEKTALIKQVQKYENEPACEYWSKQDES